jgi:antitoxin (DNA-binding transcriptional repressor) of toxin-antitoxin stability system
MSETIMTLEEAAHCFPDLVERVHATGQSTLLVKSGRGLTRIVPLSPSDNSDHLMAFLRRWRIEYPEPDEGFAEAAEESHKVIQPPNDPWA